MKKCTLEMRGENSRESRAEQSNNRSLSYYRSKELFGGSYVQALAPYL